MKWILLLVVVVLIQNVMARLPNQHSQRQRATDDSKSHKKYPQIMPSQAQVPTNGRRGLSHYQQRRLQQQQQQQQQEQQRSRQQRQRQTNAEPQVEIDTLKCPLGCVCQYERLSVLPISRWINYMQTRQPEELSIPTTQTTYKRKQQQQQLPQRQRQPQQQPQPQQRQKEQRQSPSTRRQAKQRQRQRQLHRRSIVTDRKKGTTRARTAIINNEVTYDEPVQEELFETEGKVMRFELDESTAELYDSDLLGEEEKDHEDNGNDDDDDEDGFLTNPYIKQATCILQEDTDAVALMQNLPHDLQALILLYTGVGHNKTVNLSILKPLNQLSTLEVRGPQDRTLRLVFDEPLSFLQHANFESITLLGSDSFNRPKNAVHPRDSFNYKPKSEFLGSYEINKADNSEDESLQNDDIQLDFLQLNSEEQQDSKIWPYEVYMQKLREARMPSFYGWEHLEVLRVHTCELNEIYWEMFDGLKTLQHLSLERNNIEVLPPFALYGALHIKTLSLAHNRIQDLHYRALAGLLDLKWLDLSDNRLNKLSELSFPPFPKLLRVDFRQNPIRYIFPATFWVMNATQEMYFDSRDTALELWTNTPFISLAKLRELYLGNITVSSLEHNMFKGLTSLEKLTIRGTIRKVEFDTFADMRNLRELDLANCQIQDLSMDAFMGCRKLEILNLSRNNISYIPPGLFDEQKALREIYLNGNQLRLLPYTFFLQPKLRLARLDENPWHCSCDMNNWRPKVTNQQGGPRIERCISDFHTGQKLSCHTIDDYIFDHRFAPRCNNYQGRSVYYVLRKHLQCGPGRVVRSKPMNTTNADHMRRKEKLQRHGNRLEFVLQQQQRAMAEQKARTEQRAMQRAEQAKRRMVGQNVHLNGLQKEQDQKSENNDTDNDII